MLRIQLYLYNILAAIWVFQFNSLMLAKNIQQTVSIQMLAVVQGMIILSIYLYGKLLKKAPDRNSVIRLSLALRLITSLFLFFTANQIFLLFFLVYQLGAVGLDIFFESSIVDFSIQKHLTFGKFRMFGSLGYATSGFWVSFILLLLPRANFLILLSLAVNGTLLFLNFKKPFQLVYQSEIENKKESFPLIYHVFISLGTVVITLPNSFGYFLNTYLKQSFSLSLQGAVLWGSLAVFLGSCISEMFAFLIVEKIIHRLSAKKVIAIGFILAIFRWILAFLSSNSLAFVLTYLFHGLSFAFIYVGTIYTMKDLLGEKKGGAIAIRFTFYANIAAVVLAQSYSFFLSAIGLKNLLAIYAVIGLVLFAVFLIIQKNLADESRG